MGEWVRVAKKKSSVKKKNVVIWALAWRSRALASRASSLASSHSVEPALRVSSCDHDPSHRLVEASSFDVEPPSSLCVEASRLVSRRRGYTVASRHRGVQRPLTLSPHMDCHFIVTRGASSEGCHCSDRQAGLRAVTAVTRGPQEGFPCSDKSEEGLRGRFQNEAHR